MCIGTGGLGGRGVIGMGRVCRCVLYEEEDTCMSYVDEDTCGKGMRMRVVCVHTYSTYSRTHATRKGMPMRVVCVQ